MKLIKNSILILTTKKHKNLKTVVKTEVLPIKALGITINFDALVPKWCPKFL